jgi:type IV secretion system protein VirD4
MEAAHLLGPEGIRLGYYRAPGDRSSWGQVIRYNGDGGLILVAPPRSGKARDVLVGALLEYNQSSVVIDPKGQLAAITGPQRVRMGQRVIMLNPFNVWPEILGPTCRYNPMSLLDAASPTFGAECRKLAEGLIAKSGSERDSHWTDGARTLVSSVIGHLATDEDPTYRNLAQMREIIAGTEVALMTFAQSAMGSPHAFIRQGLAEYAVKDAPNKAEIAGKISTAREQTFFLSIDTIAENIRTADFRFGWLKESPTTVYIILPDEHLDTCGKWFRLVVASALHDLWRGGTGACRVLAIIDEFAHIGHLDILEKGAGMAAGHGLQLWPVLQNLTQLKKDYGENWEAFIAGSEIRQFFATRDQTSAKYVSETSGQRTVTTAGQSVHNTKPLEHDQSSDSVGQAGQPLIRPHEISSFGPNESLIFGPRNIVIDALRQPYFDTPELSGFYAPDPQHKSDTHPPPPVNPQSVVSFGDIHFGLEEKAVQARAAKRPMALRFLMWGENSNPTLNIIRKVEYMLTLPVRLVLALLAAPFALHNKPLGAAIGFLALFGFWEVWDGFAKEPIMTVYQVEQNLCMSESWLQDTRSFGHLMACRAEGLKATANFVWRYAILATFSQGFSGAAVEFDRAFEKERRLQWNEAGRAADRIVYGTVPKPLPGHSITISTTPDVAPTWNNSSDIENGPSVTQRLLSEERVAANWRIDRPLVEELMPGALSSPRTAVGENVSQRLVTRDDTTLFVEMREAEVKHLIQRPEELQIPLYIMTLSQTPRYLNAETNVFPVVVRTSGGKDTYVHANFADPPGSEPVACIVVRLADQIPGLVRLASLR